MGKAWVETSIGANPTNRNRHGAAKGAFIFCNPKPASNHNASSIPQLKCPVTLFCTCTSRTHAYNARCSSLRLFRRMLWSCREPASFYYLGRYFYIVLDICGSLP